MRLSPCASHVPLVASLVAVLLAPGFGGCDTGLQKTLDAKRTERYALARQAVFQVEAERNKTLTDTLPKVEEPLPPGREIVKLKDGSGAITLIDKGDQVLAVRDEKPVADGEYVLDNDAKMTVAAGIAKEGRAILDGILRQPHPLAGWRRQLSKRNDERKLARETASESKEFKLPSDDQKLGLLAKHAKPLRDEEAWMKVGGRGTPAEIAAKLGAQFVKESDEYWSGRSHLRRYLDVLKNYPAEIEKAKAQLASDKIENKHENLEKEIAALLPQIAEANKKVDEASAEFDKSQQTKADVVKLKAVKAPLKQLNERLDDLKDRLSRPYVEEDYEFVPPPFLDEAHFDQFFLHAVGWLNMSRIANQDQIYMAFWDDYEVAFNTHRSMTDDGFSAFVSRLCFIHPQLREKCHGIPHEYRGGIVHHAFLEWLRGKASEFTPVMDNAKVFGEVAKRMVQVIDTKMAELPKPEEEPVLPSTIASVAGISGPRAVFSEKAGVKFNDKVVAEKWQTTAIAADLATALGKTVQDMKDNPANKLDFQRVVLEMPGTVSLATFITAVRAFPTAIVKELSLVGRRRVDDSMRRASMKLRRPRSDDTQNMSFQFKEDKDKKQCALLGTLGDAPVGKKQEYFMEITADKIRATPVTRNEETQELIPGETADLGSPKDLTAVLKWLDTNPGRVRLFMGADYTYEQATDLLSRLLYTCEDQKIELEDASQPPMTRTCGKSEQRSVTFVLAVCGIPEK